MPLTPTEAKRLAEQIAADERTGARDRQSPYENANDAYDYLASQLKPAAGTIQGDTPRDTKYDPEGGFWQQLVDKAPSNAVTDMKNLGALGAEVGKVALDAIGNPLALPKLAFNQSKELVDLLLGGNDEMQRRFNDGEDTERAQKLRAVGSRIMNTWGSPKRYIIEEPLMALLDFASIGRAGSRLAARAGFSGVERAIQGTADALNPLKSLNTAGAVVERLAPHAARAADATARGVSTAAQVGGAVASGKSPMALEQAFKAGKRGGQASKEFMGRLNEAVPTSTLADMVDNIYDAYKSSRELVYQGAKGRFKIKEGKSLSLDEVKQELYGVARDTSEEGFNVRVHNKPTKTVASTLLGADGQPLPGTPGKGRMEFDLSRSTIATSKERKTVTQMLEAVRDWKGDGIEDIHLLKKNIDGFRKAGKNYARHNRMVAKFRKVVGDYLEDRVTGYEEATKGWKWASEQLEGMEKMLGADRHNKELIVSKLHAILDEAPSKDVRRELVAVLEGPEGAINLSAQVAGMELSSWLPAGLFGKGKAYSAATDVARVGMGYGALSGAFSPFTLLTLPFFSPRLAAKIFHGLGMTSKQIAKMKKFTHDIEVRLPPGAATDGMSYAAVIQNYLGLIPPAPQDLGIADRAVEYLVDEVPTRVKNYVEDPFAPRDRGVLNPLFGKRNK